MLIQELIKFIQQDSCLVELLILKDKSRSTSCTLALAMPYHHSIPCFYGSYFHPAILSIRTAIFYQVVLAESIISSLNAFLFERKAHVLFYYKLLREEEEIQAAAFSIVPVPHLISSPGVCVSHICNAASISVRSVPCCLQSHF